MRLSEDQKKSISAACNKIFHNQSIEVYLFGSKAYADKKGGDIDLLVLSEDFLDKAIIRKLKIELERNLGERKFDVINSIFSITTDNFINLIKEEKVIKLWENKIKEDY